MPNALERFRRELTRWRNARAEAGPTESLEHLYARVLDTLGPDILRQVGGAFENDWLRTQDDAAYNVRRFDPRTSTMLPGPAVYPLTCGGDPAGVWWELFVQLADYGRLRSAVDADDVDIRLEDRLMDITVWSGKELVYYVENKTHAREAASLLEGMQAYGLSGFDPEVVARRGDDALRKSKYLFTYESRPRWFGLSAIGYQKLFRIDYVDVGQRRFHLVEVVEPLLKPVIGLRPEGSPPPRCPADPLALAFERLAGRRFWVSPGTGLTAFNVYAPAEDRDALVFGLYQDGRVWTDVAALGSVSAARLASALSSVGIRLDTTASWTFWKRDSDRFVATESDVQSIAAAVSAALA